MDFQSSAAMLPQVESGVGAAGWLNGRRWDLTWLIGSALVIPAVVLLVWAGVSSAAINLGVTAVIGGPHLFSTYTATYLDPRFRRSRGIALVAISIAVPAFVVYWSVVDLQILLSVFIFLASLHVLQQNAYLSDIYRRRVGHPEPRWSRFVDYGVLMLSFYPVASVKLVHGDFSLGDVKILIPPFLLVPATYWAVWIAFAGFLLAWLVKTGLEVRRGLLNRPKTLLIGLTVVVAFFVPMMETSGRLELVFQAVNTWHSIQYLGIILLVQRLRSEQGLIDSRPGRWMNSGRSNLRTYGACLVTTLVLMGGVFLLARADPFHMSFPQYYFMFVLSALLIHYVLDGYMFAAVMRGGRSSVDVPLATLAPSSSA